MSRGQSRADWMRWSTVLLLAGTLGLYELTGLDLWLQDFFYNAATHRWIVDENEPIGRVLFYYGPKVVVSIIAAIALGFALGPFRWRERFRFGRRGLWLALLVIATVPVFAGIVKKYTNTFCPAETRRYGGDVAYTILCEPYPADDQPSPR